MSDYLHTLALSELKDIFNQLSDQREKNVELKQHIEELYILLRVHRRNSHLRCLDNEKLKEQIEKMKSDVKGNIKWAEQNKNELMRQKLCSMLNQWEVNNED